MTFADREEAGRSLLKLLRPLQLTHPLILALPRGGVPVAFEIAAGLNAEMDVLIVRKLGAPDQPELAIGAVIDGGRPEILLNERLVARLGVSEDYLKGEVDDQLREIERRKEKYRGARPDPLIEGRPVIVVDDGIATGATVKAALTALRRRNPSRLVLAIPLAPPDALDGLRSLVDEVVCPLLPEDFQAVGQFYEDFHAVEDREVIALLEKGRKIRR